MTFPQARFVATGLGIAASLLVTGCDDDLQQRIDRLEAELREVRSDTRDDVTQLKNRVIAAENRVGVTSDGRSIDDRLDDLERSIGDVISMKASNNEMVYLRPNLQGHAPIRTDHGTFLVRMEGMDINLKRGGFTVHLNIGNPHAIAVEQFSIAGDHGGGPPELGPDEDYSLENEKIRKWQSTLKPFEYRVTKTLEPFSWTPFDIELEADSREEIELIRLSMLIENARLKRQDMGGDQGSGSFAHVDLNSEGASVLKTEYGSFLINVKEAEATDLGTRLHLEIGNPYGFTVNQCRLVGEYAESIPIREETESTQDFNQRRQAWSGTLQPFEAMISEKISNFRWNKATVLIPAPAEQVRFLRCQLRIEDISLPAAGR